MREYVVSLNKDVDYDSFWNEIESISATDGFIPSRRVEIVNNRNGSLRSCHYALTEEEASILKDDPRVFSVEIPPEQRTDIQLGFTTTQIGNFNKTTSPIGDNINWGLIRHSFNDNIYRLSISTSLNYNYTNDGTGVDVVIMDSGLEINHPEFTDNQGASRVQQIDWFAAAQNVIPGSQSVNFYRDYDGHGTHVAGITAGKTYGWAKNSRIYSLKINGLEGTGDTGNGISITNCFDLVKLWHTNKPIDPITGIKRPTVVNMSFGYSTQYVSIIGGSYRGTTWVGANRIQEYGMTGEWDGSYYRHPVRVSSVDVDIEELIDAGVTVCISAGNNYTKIDIPNGSDYNNYYNRNTGGQIYYNRGMSPYSDRAIIVGSLDSVAQTETKDKKSSFSNSGPGIDIFAAGSNIMSSCSNITSFGSYSSQYYLNSNFKQANISGTSMASPQIAGQVALYLQDNKSATPSVVKQWLLSKATSSVYKTSSDNDYTNFISNWGGDINASYISFNDNKILKGYGLNITNMRLFKTSDFMYTSDSDQIKTDNNLITTDVM